MKITIHAIAAKVIRFSLLRYMYNDRTIYHYKVISLRSIWKHPFVFLSTWLINFKSLCYYKSWCCLIGAFLEKRVDYSHSLSSLFFIFLFFFRYTWSDQNSSTPKDLQNFKKTPNCTRWPKELNQKGFPHNIQYRTRPKGPPFQFFRHCGKNFSGNFSPKGPSFNFFRSCATEWMLKNPKRSPVSVFLALWDFFSFFK